MKESIQINDINPAPSANAPGTSIVTLPVGRIHGVEIITTTAAAKMAAGFGDVRLMIGGNQNRVGTLTEISDTYSLYDAELAVKGDVNGGPARVAYLFTENFRKQYLAAERFALDNPGDANGVALRDTQLEIDYKNTAAAKSLIVRALVEPLAEATDAQAHNALTKHFRKSYPVASDELFINDLARKDVYQLIDLYDPADAEIETVKVKIDGKYRLFRTKDEQDQDLKRWGMNPREGVFSIVPDMTDNTADGWNMRNIREFIIEVTLSGVSNGAVKVITHRFGLPE